MLLDCILTCHRWIRQLSSIFQERGITVLDSQLLEPEADIACAWTSMHMNGIKELANISGEGSRYVLEKYGQAAQEVQKGAYISMLLVNVLGRKAGGN